MSLKIGFLSTILCAVIVSCSGHIIRQNELQKINTSPGIESRVIGGQVVDEGFIPYIVAINTTFGNHICSGSIITSKHILTAAHCLEYDKKYLLVLTGAIYLNAPDAVYNVEETIVHCSHNKPWMHNDVGLILLSKKIVFNEFTQIIQMSTDIFLSRGEQLSLSGWGAVKKYGRSSPVLQTVTVKSISDERCQKSVKNKKWLGPENICTSTREGRGSCNNDSGGPLVSEDGRLVGIVSWGDPCVTGRPDVFSSVAHYQDFINSVLDGQRDC